MQYTQKQSKAIVISIFTAIGLWLLILLFALSWFQSRYINEFTHHQTQFLKADFTERWFEQLLTLLPPKSSQARIIQLWQPGCICNRFARPHAVKAMNISNTLGFEHITLIPEAYADQQETLQALNPETKILVIDSSQLHHWPNSPSVIIEGPFNRLEYIGPIGFGAFCSQATTSSIETQLKGIANDTSRPFYNQVGQGCFCQWNKLK